MRNTTKLLIAGQKVWIRGVTRPAIGNRRPRALAFGLRVCRNSGLPERIGGERRTWRRNFSGIAGCRRSRYNNGTDRQTAEWPSPSVPSEVETVQTVQQGLVTIPGGRFALQTQVGNSGADAA